MKRRSNYDHRLLSAVVNPRRTAWYSADEKYRYGLEIRWDLAMRQSNLMVIGLNPSTATEEEDDPTIRRCIGFAKDWGHGGLFMTNIAAYRATDPKAMFAQPDPIGPENFFNDIIGLAASPGKALAAWGNHGAKLRISVLEFLRGLKYVDIPVVHLGLCANGEPRHPLYIMRDTKPEPFGLENYGQES